MTPKVVDKKSKTAHIARTAVSVFRVRGFQKTRMVDIAEAAGVGKGTLYEYFKDKDQMLEVAMKTYFDDFHAGALKAVSEGRSAAESLRRLVAFALSHAEEWEDHCFAFIDAAGTGRVEQRGREWLSEMFDEARTMVRILIEAGQSQGVFRTDLRSEVIAEMILSVYEGYLMLGVLGVRRPDTSGDSEGMIAVIEKGVLA